MCWRDSFGVALYPYLAESFHDARFSRSATYDLIRIETDRADAVLIEIVERNIGFLLENMPVYPAPERKMPEAASRIPALAVSSEQGKTALSSYMTLVKCEIPSEYADYLRDAFFVCDGVCYEAAVLYPEGSSPVISAWIPSGSPSDVIVIFGDQSAYYQSDAA